MSTKTDLAKEIIGKKSPFYSKITETNYKNTKITEVRIETEEESALFEKPKGSYFTVEADSIRTPFEKFDEEAEAVALILSGMIPKKGDILAVGLGNAKLTADSLGPKTAEKLFCGEFFGRKLFSLSPGVSGKSGADPVLLIKAAAEKLSPAAIILIDSLAAENISHIGRTVQITDSGLAPGSGISGGKTAASKETMGVPVAALGVPMVIRYPDSDSVFVSPGEVDAFIKRAARLLAAAVELAVFPKFGTDIIKEAVL